jgi:SAM-dependent methyltransferase
MESPMSRGNPMTAEGNMRDKAEAILRSLEKDASSFASPETSRWWSGYLQSHVDHYLNTLSFIQDDDLKSHILEIGCAPGHFSVLLKLLDVNFSALDIDPSRVQPIWDKYDIAVDTVDIEKDALPYASDSFDLIIFAEILEHLRLNPLHALREIYRVLKPGGRILLSTPNITPSLRLRFLFGGRYQGNPVKAFKRLERRGHMGHIRLYAIDEVHEFLEYANFRVQSSAYRGSHLVEGRKERLLYLVYPYKEHFCKRLYVVASK